VGVDETRYPGLSLANYARARSCMFLLCVCVCVCVCVYGVAAGACVRARLMRV
jgi:hypothetical protein